MFCLCDLNCIVVIINKSRDINNGSLPHGICLILLGDSRYTPLDPAHFYLMHFPLHILCHYDSISFGR